MEAPQIVSQAEAAKRFGITRQWLYRHRQQLRMLPRPAQGDKRYKWYYLEDLMQVLRSAHSLRIASVQ